MASAAAWLGALVGTLLGLGLLLPIYAIGGMGAGDVKMTMGFGSWIGAFFGMAKGCEIILWAFCTGTIVGGIIALVMIVVRGNIAKRATRPRHRRRHVPILQHRRSCRQGQQTPAALASPALRRAAVHRLPRLPVLLVRNLSATLSRSRLPGGTWQH